ncbi:MAG TPA: SusC/RagA family TonB-linked outer membrane protein, partial [Membranihabitans sp.]|nr:SusC/RagA family TonB-linked outer membrane protein [Membranihabitans sp.]
MSKILNSGILLVIGVLCLCLTNPRVVYADNFNKNPYPKYLQKESLVKLIRKWEERYNVLFTYDRRIVESVEVEVPDPEMREINLVLEYALQETELKFTILENRYVVLYRNNAEGIKSLEKMIEHLNRIIDTEKETMRLKAIPPVSPLQTLPTRALFDKRLVYNLSGRVMDQFGEPLVGVNLIIKGTNRGTASDLDGYFTLEDVDENDVLVVSYVGYITQEIPVGSQQNIRIILLEDVQTLDEVVVVGYGTQKKSDLTGSVQRVNIGLFEGAPNTNILQSLSGIAPGLSVGKTFTTGSEPQLQIRGQNTLSGGTSPLIVLDGMVYRGNIGDINPSDVESVDILKDASSKAVYGAQAANGVIIITTKSGVRQKPTLNVSTYYSHQTPANSLRTLTWEEFLQEARNHSYKKAYLAPDYVVPNPDFVITDNVQWNINTLDGYNKGVDYDWMGSATSPGYIFNTDISVNGGSDDFSYMLSFNYNNQKGWVINDIYNRKSGRINLNYDITNWLTIGTNSFLSFADFSGDSPSFSTIAFMNPLNTPFIGNAEEGEYELYPDGITLNPFIYGASEERNIRSHLMTKAFAIVKVPWVKNLTYTANYSFDYSSYPHVYSNEYIQGGAGRAYGSYSDYNGIIFDNILNFTTQLGNHQI